MLANYPMYRHYLSRAPHVQYGPDQGSFIVSLGVPRQQTDKYERLLREVGRPIHYWELASRITAAGGTAKVQFLAEQLSNDSRFKPIGRSGLWGLSQ